MTGHNRIPTVSRGSIQVEIVVIAIIGVAAIALLWVALS